MKKGSGIWKVFDVTHPEFKKIKIVVDKFAGRISPQIINTGHNKFLIDSLNVQLPSFLDSFLERKIKSARFARALL